MKGLVVKIVLAITRWRWMRWLFTKTRVGRRVSLRFVAGETLEEAIDVARNANASGLPVSLNLLGEHVTDATMAQLSYQEYARAIEQMEAAGIDGNISIKLTQLGLGLDRDLCRQLTGQLAVRAAEAGTTITIDMEDTSVTDLTLGLFEEVQREHGNVGVALQAYLRRTPGDLRRIAPLGGHIRLCKGAYDEPEALAFRSRREVNEAYDRLMGELMADGRVRPALATHDPDRVDAALAVAGERRGDWEFQTLYGINVPLQERLQAEGHTLRIYIPYGEAWYPYLTRRIAERPANVWFFVRAVFGRR